MHYQKNTFLAAVEHQKRYLELEFWDTAERNITVTCTMKLNTSLGIKFSAFLYRYKYLGPISTNYKIDILDTLVLKGSEILNPL